MLLKIKCHINNAIAYIYIIILGAYVYNPISPVYTTDLIDQEIEDSFGSSITIIREER